MTQHKEGDTLVETLEERKMGHTKRELERAEVAKNLYEMIMFPSMNDFKTVIKMNGIWKCPVTLDDVKRCEAIYGPNVYALKGKSVRSKPPVVLNDYVKVPPELKVKNEDVELCADIMYIQGIPFLVTVSKRLKFVTITHIAKRSKALLCEAFDKTFRVYNKAGFRITKLHVDREFEVLEEAMMDEDNSIEMVYAAAQQHVPEIERMIRVIKERYRALYHRLPYERIPKLMIIAAAYRVVKWLNMLPAKGGSLISLQSPRNRDAEAT